MVLTAEHLEFSVPSRKSYNLPFNFLIILVPRPIMVVELNQNYLQLPKEVLWYLFLEAANSFDEALQTLLVVEQEWWGSWITSYKICEKERKTRYAPRSKPQKKKKVSLMKLERTQRIRGERLERVAYDPKTGWKVRGYFRLNKHACFLWHSPKIMYICGKLNFTICMYTIFPISMQKTVRPQIGPVKKKNSHVLTKITSIKKYI